MQKSEAGSVKHGRNDRFRWVISIFLVTIVISAGISFLSEEVIADSHVAVAFVILLAIILVGIFFDILGVAVTSAKEAPFHSMAARKVSGAQEAIRLLRSAERVSSICNDVIGDICGVVSGSAAATIAAQLLVHFEWESQRIVLLGMSALVAALTVGGKALGKAYAIRSCTQIVHAAGRLIHVLGRISGKRGHKKINR